MENGNKVRASRRKYHYIYKTTCLITNKYYIGMHSTSNLDDGYQGSGTILARSIRAHGKENHQTEILEFLPTRKDLKQREAELVNEELINDVMCMNLQLGGGGGFVNEDHYNKFAEGRKEGYKKGLDKQKWLKENDEDWYNHYRKQLSINANKQVQEGRCKLSFKGRKHSTETKAKMSSSQQGKQSGSKNSQYGKCWITNGIESKKIYKGDVIPEGWKLGRVIKKIK